MPLSSFASLRFHIALSFDFITLFLKVFRIYNSLALFMFFNSLFITNLSMYKYNITMRCFENR